MDSTIRIGRVSAVNEKNGMVRVTYSDRGNAVTSEMPYITYNNEYCAPEVNALVLTAHLSNGNSRGVVIGTIWNQKHTPPECKKGLYRKDLSTEAGKAVQRYDEETEEYLLKAPDIKLEDKNWKTSLSNIMERLAALDGNNSERKG